MHRRLYISAITSTVLLVAIAGCSSSSSDSSADGTDGVTDGAADVGGTDSLQPRLVTEIDPQDQSELLRDTQTGLVWVNDIRFCFAGVTDPEANNCAALNDATVAGANNWRIPTTEEMSALILAVVDDETVELNYINPACAVMTASDGWVFTENSSSPGTISTVAPGNAGLRCVYTPPDS